MWLSKRHGLRGQIKRLESEIKSLRKERQQIEAKGCYSDKELTAKEIQLEDYRRRIQILALELDRLQLLPYALVARDDDPFPVGEEING
jgi:chromosome segregation ATPase